ncbi:NAD-dependent epimerase/dehydratase family protein [Streptomyces virginiae]|uniref:NAD-dependent epimerase/dehydratase family protein n=1 Tax=Streptomyces virginiae TaxID=1961 RepID=UPI002257E0AB|nr:NAD(P)-dependent oxidoreductase [Streptomyces virginiae]MCX4957486.1 NAD(P)-dependent oxidoreductase [Streptomyces virginiae]
MSPGTDTEEVRPMAHEEPRDTHAPLEGRSVVVLGATGFLGRHICAAFEEARAHVCRVARGAGRGAASPDVVLDLVSATPERIAQVLAGAGADIVVNAAGAVWGVDEQQMLRANAELPVRLLEAIGLRPRPPRLVHLGSAHEYGRTPPGARIDEELQPAPDGPYGRTKLVGTRAVLEAGRSGSVDGVVLRISNVSGPAAPGESLLGTVAAHLSAVRRAGVREGFPQVPPLRLAPLRARRDFVDVRDVADAVVAAARADVRGEVVNIGSGEAVGVRQLTDRLIELSGLPVTVLEEGERPAPADREGAAESGRSDAEWQLLDISRAARLLGWRPRRTLDDSLGDLLAQAVFGGATPEAAQAALGSAPVGVEARSSPVSEAEIGERLTSREMRER